MHIPTIDGCLHVCGYKSTTWRWGCWQCWCIPICCLWCIVAGVWFERITRRRNGRGEGEGTDFCRWKMRMRIKLVFCNIWILLLHKPGNQSWSWQWQNWKWLQGTTVSVDNWSKLWSFWMTPRSWPCCFMRSQRNQDCWRMPSKTGVARQ